MSAIPQGRSGDFPYQYSTILSTTHQPELLKSPSNPLKPRNIA